MPMSKIVVELPDNIGPDHAMEQIERAFGWNNQVIISVLED